MQKLVAVLLFLTMFLIGCKAPAGKDVKLENDKQKYSYAIGYQIGSNMKTQGLDVDTDALTAALQEGLEGKKSRLSEKDTAEARRNMQQKMIADRQKKAEENKKTGETFLENNKKRPEVKVTESGLQYEVLTAGNGESPKASDTVSVHYRGTLIDETEFDSSYKRNAPAEFPVGGVIRGWTEALQLMKVGGKWKLYIPSELAYGASGRPSIPPNSTLIFEVELLGIKK